MFHCYHVAIFMYSVIIPMYSVTGYLIAQLNSIKALNWQQFQYTFYSLQTGIREPPLGLIHKPQLTVRKETYDNEQRQTLKKFLTLMANIMTIGVN